jgi:hypothetical protein
MSAVNFVIQDEAVLAASDTLSVDYDTRELRTFTSKIHLLPHMRMAVMGTGINEFFLDWHRRLLQEAVPQDITGLDEWAPKALGQAWSRYAHLQISTTVFHFGYAPGEERFVGYQYHSGHGFESERLPRSGFKPVSDELVDVLEVVGDASVKDLFKKAIEVQKEQDESRPKEKRLGIGGEIQMLTLTEEAMRIETIKRFSDYDDQLDAVQKPQ